MTTRTQPRITDPTAVKQYAEQVMQMRAMLANLSEFLDTMPATDDNGYVVGIDYGHLGSLNEMHTHVVTASEISDELGE